MDEEETPFWWALAVFAAIARIRILWPVVSFPIAFASLGVIIWTLLSGEVSLLYLAVPMLILSTGSIMTSDRGMKRSGLDLPDLDPLFTPEPK